MEPYHGLVFHAWLPVFRAFANQWIVKNAEPMVDLIDLWESILPTWILENILDQLILPKIQKVDNFCIILII
jgi:tuftelin-interacting protein 11